MSSQSRSLDTGTHPIETQSRGYIAFGESHGRVGVGMYARRSTDSIRRTRPDSVVTNVERAQDILRTYHDWELPSESEIATALCASIN